MLLQRPLLLAVVGGLLLLIVVIVVVVVVVVIVIVLCCVVLPLTTSLCKRAKYTQSLRIYVTRLKIGGDFKLKSDLFEIFVDFCLGQQIIL